MQKPGILRILEYSELFHICIPTYIGTLSYLRKRTNIQNSGMFETRQIFRTVSEIQDGVFFAKNNYNYFCNLLLLIFFTGF